MEVVLPTSTQSKISLPRTTGGSILHTIKLTMLTIYCVAFFPQTGSDCVAHWPRFTAYPQAGQFFSQLKLSCAEKKIKSRPGASNLPLVIELLDKTHTHMPLYF